MIPDPMDCASLEERNRINAVFGAPVAPPPPPYPLHNSDGLIVPRKPQNPCLESRGHKDLHRELLFNQKVGKNVLGQKSELQRALEKREDARRREAQRKADDETQLTRIVTERVRRMEITNLKSTKLQRGASIEDSKCFSWKIDGNKSDPPAQASDPDCPEFLRVHAKLRGRTESQ